MSEKSLKNILEGALLAAGRPLSVDQMLTLFLDQDQPSRDDIKAALDELQVEYENRSIELKKVASGYRVQVRTDYSEWVSRLWAEKPSRYSRALLETLALVAYRQPITRGEIEDIRGVSVSSSIMKTLQERDWIKVVGHRDVPGKPAMYATTRAFLDYFNLSTLDEMPTLAELKDIDSINAELEFDIPGVPLEGEEAEDIEAGEADVETGISAPDTGDEASLPTEATETETTASDEETASTEEDSTTEQAGSETSDSEDEETDEEKRA